MRRRSLLAVAALITAVALGGCGSSADPESAPASGGGSAPASAPASAPPSPSAATATRPAHASASYVALGDSYAAAPGVPTTTVAGGCFRSDHDYPHLLARARPDLRLTDVTCSGATTVDLTSPQRIVQVSVPPQLDALTRSTRLVTLGIGGNDLGLFEAVLDRCLQGDRTCLQGIDTTRDTAVVQHRLVDALRRIHRRSPAARVVLVGYPQLVAPDARGCAALPADPTVLASVRRLVADFSTMMARAAKAGGATYVDLIGPSAGHDICSSSPWINGNESDGQAIAFHPLLAEQEAVAALLQKTVA